MGRTEPCLVPEWLKGGTGTGAGSTHFSHQGTSNLADYDSQRNSAPYRPPYALPRRAGGSNGNVTERLSDKDSHYRSHTSSSKYNFGRAYDGPDRDREMHRSELEYDREFDRERDWISGLGSDNERRDGFESFRRNGDRLEADLSLPRQSATYNRTLLKNGTKKSIISEPGSPSLTQENGSLLVSKMYKTGLERSFSSSRGTLERPAIQSHLVDMSTFSPRPLWQAPRPEFSSTSVAGVTSGTLQVSIDSPDSPASRVDVESPTSTPSESSAAVNGDAHSIRGGSSNMSKVNDLGMHIPPRVRTPPLVETQRLDELSLKQSRQLIPMKPSLPKAMDPAAREKSKPKLGNTAAPAAVRSALPTSQTLNASSYRSPLLSRSDASNKPVQGKLFLLKTSKETGLRSDRSANTSLGSPSITSGSATVGNATNPANLAAAPWKQRSAGELKPLASNAGNDNIRPRDGWTVSEDRRPTVPVQNRSDFFNSLRKKAAESGAIQSAGEKLQEKSEVRCNENHVIDKQSSLSDETRHAKMVHEENHHVDMVEKEEQHANMAGSQQNGVIGEDVNGTIEKSNGLIANGHFVGLHEKSIVNGDYSLEQQSSPVGGTEEEEAAFMRSLGWEEGIEEEDAALTEEEITTFLQEHMRSLTSSPSLLSQKLKNAILELHIEVSGNLSSAVNTSERKSDVEVRVHRP